MAFLQRCVHGCFSLIKSCISLGLSAGRVCACYLPSIFLGVELDSASIAPQAKLLHFRLGHEIDALLLS